MNVLDWVCKCTEGTMQVNNADIDGEVLPLSVP